MNQSFAHFQLLPFLFFVFIVSCKGQEQTTTPEDSLSSPTTKAADFDPYFIESSDTISLYGPTSITRNIEQDREGNIWLATWEGIIQYDGKTFTNHTNKEGLRRFHAFNVMEDSKGNIWSGTIGAGVYLYNGKTFTNFTTQEGLASDQTGWIYEDKKGHIWIGTYGGISVYDGESLQNFTTEDGLMSNDINAIIEDQNGTFWIGARGEASLFDGQQFTKLTNKEGRPFFNVRSIIKDQNNNMWLGGNDGLWRYSPAGEGFFTQYSMTFTGYIFEDTKGNIWTSSGQASYWELSCYDVQNLHDPKIPPTKIIAKSDMFFGIKEDKDGGIWFGTLNGVCRYDTSALIRRGEDVFNYFRPTDSSGN